ncbi:general secretion pathway protein N [Caulobacter sp. BE264]|uniref:type II secretion system protein N n=1 Tax=Caulobacter sp. BE264 TaxID=2817724 RepID=UPI0028604433|nr:type II secretion system protein N [Caulobacter sp. BE264]MDR7229893.1 general secretion pathway protein N [Caulobacter sp. BE264]
MSNRLLLVVLAVATLVMVLVFAPMRLLTKGLAGSSVVGAAGVSGVVWAGRLNHVTLSGTPIGSWKGGLNPLTLLTGQVRMSLRRGNGGPDQRAVLLLAGRERGVERLNLRTSLDLALLGLPLSGDVAFRDTTAVFRKGRCARAGGEIRLRLIGEGPLSGSVLSGVSACRSDSWIATLSGKAGATDLTLVGRLEKDGRYQLEMSATTTDPDLVQALVTGGFQRDATGARRTVTGRVT